MSHYLSFASPDAQSHTTVNVSRLPVRLRPTNSIQLHSAGASDCLGPALVILSDSLCATPRDGEWRAYLFAKQASLTSFALLSFPCSGPARASGAPRARARFDSPSRGAHESAESGFISVNSVYSAEWRATQVAR